MKQYTTSEQTAKLIELGFEKPKNTRYVQHAKARNLRSPFLEFGEPEFEGSYTIGELLSFLPENIAKENEMPSTLNISLLNGEWWVEYADFLGADFSFHNTELIDNLFDMCKNLKEGGVI